MEVDKADSGLRSVVKKVNQLIDQTSGKQTLTYMNVLTNASAHLTHFIAFLLHVHHFAFWIIPDGKQMCIIVMLILALVALVVVVFYV